MLKHIVRIQNDYLRITLVTLVWPLQAVKLYCAAALHGRMPTKGMLGMMYHVACGGL